MAIQLGGGGLGVKRHAYPQNAEMNITPFVDVVLVLLIIFMVAAPLATVDVPLDLPQSSIAPTPTPAEPVYISVRQSGELFIQNAPTDIASLPALLLAQTKGNRDNRIFIRGDEKIEYRRLMEIINLLQEQGYNKVGLIAEQRDR
ncbi:MAG: biopolymer transporter ExbD [Rhodocyclaceae bacterium]|nr:biopolymer transporter ExbD [Rhodocyclaceae bacterium]